LTDRVVRDALAALKAESERYAGLADELESGPRPEAIREAASILRILAAGYRTSSDSLHP
jgi:hypothetical protein